MPHDDVLLLLDEEGRITRWEHSAEELFGWTAAEAVGRSAEALIRSLCTNGGKPLEGCPGPGALLIKPALQDHSLVWRVLAAEDDATVQDAAVLRALVTRAPMALRVFDDQLHVVRVSLPAGRLRDTPARSSPGAPFSEVCGFAADEEAAVARGVLESGKPVVNRLVQSVERSAKLGRHVLSASYLPIKDLSGTVLGLVTLTADVTERERALGSQALLERVRTQMGHRLSLIDVCQELAQAVVPAFADIAAVELVDSAVRGEVPPAAPVGPGVLLRQAAVHGLRPAAQVGAVHPLPAGTPFSHVLSDLQPRLMQVDTGGTWPADDPARADIIEKSTVHSLIVAPLAIGDEILGMVSFYRTPPKSPSPRRTSPWRRPCAHMRLSASTGHACT